MSGSYWSIYGGKSQPAMTMIFIYGVKSQPAMNMMSYMEGNANLQ